MFDKMLFNYITFIILFTIRSIKSAPVRPIDLFTVHMKVKLDLNDESIVQVSKFYYPSVYETNLYTPIRLEEAFFVIGEVTYNNQLIYGDTNILLNRFVNYSMPRPGLQIVHIASYYLDKGNYYENIEFICDFYEIFRFNEHSSNEQNDSHNQLKYRENIHKLITVDLSDLNSLSLTLEIRFREDKIEIFVSDIFKPFIKIGAIKYKNYIINNDVRHCYYRSLTCKFDDNLIYLSVLIFLNNAERNEIKYTINTQGTNQEECVQKTEDKKYIMTRLP